MASSTKSRAMISAERDAVEVDAGRVHDREHDRQHQRTDSATTMPGASRDGGTLGHVPSASTKSHELDTECSTMSADWRLTHRPTEAGRDRVHRRLEVFAERDQVRTVLHRNAEPERRLATFPDDEAWRVLVATLDSRDVAKPEDAAVHLHGNGGDRVHARECAGDTQIDAVGRGLHRPAGRDRVLSRHAVEDLLRGDAEARELCVAEFNEDFFGLLPDEVDLVDVGDAQESLADILGAP